MFSYNGFTYDGQHPANVTCAHRAKDAEVAVKTKNEVTEHYNYNVATRCGPPWPGLESLPQCCQHELGGR